MMQCLNCKVSLNLPDGKPVRCPQCEELFARILSHRDEIKAIVERRIHAPDNFEILGRGVRSDLVKATKDYARAVADYHGSTESAWEDEFPDSLWREPEKAAETFKRFNDGAKWHAAEMNRQKAAVSL